MLKVKYERMIVICWLTGWLVEWLVVWFDG